MERGDDINFPDCIQTTLKTPLLTTKMRSDIWTWELPNIMLPESSLFEKDYKLSLQFFEFEVGKVDKCFYFPSRENVSKYLKQLWSKEIEIQISLKVLLNLEITRSKQILKQM